MMAYHHILVHETLHCHRLSQHQSYQSKLENQSPLFQFQFGTHPKLKSYAPVPQESRILHIIFKNCPRIPHFTFFEMLF